MSLSGTRNSASVAATYAVMRNLGRDGYRKVVKRCMENTRYLAKKLRDIGHNPVIEPKVNILAVRVRNPLNIIEAMNENGWRY